MTLSYLELQVAQQLFGREPEGLDQTARARVTFVARRRQQIESAVLASAEAGGVHVPDSAVNEALSALRGRYPDADSFAAELSGLGLDEAGIEEALRRQLTVDAVLERVSATVEPVSRVDIELFYHLNQARFVSPERRRARHLLITVNEALAGNGREAVRGRIEAIRTRLAARPARFAEEVQRHSECPTALDGGLLGDVPRGTLYPELEAVLFSLRVGELSESVESPLGFHLLRCDGILPATRVGLDEVEPRIREALQDQRARQQQKVWLEALLRDRRG